MSDRLKSFLSEIAVSPEKMSSYLENPDAAMKQAGLDAEDCAALKSGDPARLYTNLSGSSAPAQGVAQPVGPASIPWFAQPPSPTSQFIYFAPPQPPALIYFSSPQPPGPANPLIYFAATHPFVYAAAPSQVPMNIPFYAGQLGCLIFVVLHGCSMWAAQPQRSPEPGAQQNSQNTATPQGQ